MKRREMLASVVAAPFLAGKSGENQRGPLPQSKRMVSRVTEEGLVPIEWNEIQDGDWIVLVDWEEGRIVRMGRYKVLSRPADDGHGAIGVDWGNAMDMACKLEPQRAW